MSTIAADPLSLLPRGDAVAGPVVLTGPGEGADFALALADVMAAEATPAVAGEMVGEGDAGTPALPTALGEGTASVPLKLLEGFGRIVLPQTADAAPPDAPVETVMQAVGQVAVGVEPETDLAGARPADPAALSAEGAVTVPAAADAPQVVAGPADAPALPVMAQPIVAEDEAEALPTDAGADVGEEELPVAGMAEAVTTAVAIVVAAPLAAAAGPAPTDAPKQDAGAEAVRLAGAAPLMAQPVKARKAEAAAPEKGQPKDAAEGDEVKSSKEDKDKPSDQKLTVRGMQVAPEPVARPASDRRAEPAAPVVDALRGADTAATAPAPQMQAAPPLTAQAAAPAPVAMDRPGWEAAVADRIAAELSEDGQQIELDLTPERLGGLKITLEISDGQAQVRFVTETPEAARLIQQNEHRLSESLSRAGLSLGGHESASRDPQQQQGDRSGRGAARGAEIAFQRPADPRPGMIPGRAGSGLVNLIA